MRLRYQSRGIADERDDYHRHHVPQVQRHHVRVGGGQRALHEAGPQQAVERRCNRRRQAGLRAPVGQHRHRRRRRVLDRLAGNADHADRVGPESDQQRQGDRRPGRQHDWPSAGEQPAVPSYSELVEQAPAQQVVQPAEVGDMSRERDGVDNHDARRQYAPASGPIGVVPQWQRGSATPPPRTRRETTGAWPPPSPRTPARSRQSPRPAAPPRRPTPAPRTPSSVPEPGPVGAESTPRARNRRRRVDAPTTRPPRSRPRRRTPGPLGKSRSAIASTACRGAGFRGRTVRRGR